MKKKTLTQAIEEIEGYYEQLSTIAVGDVDNVELAQIRVEIGLAESAFHENKGNLPTSEFWQLVNLCKNLREVIQTLDNNALVYYKAIKNECRKEIGEEGYLRCVEKVKLKLGRR